MGKTGLIIRREYWTRVRTRTFIVMCFLGPLLWAALIIIPPLLAGKNILPRRIVVVDETNMSQELSYANVFHDTMNLHFVFNDAFEPLNNVKKKYRDSSQVSILWFPANFMGGAGAERANSSPSLNIQLFSKNEPGSPVLNYLESAITEEVRKEMMLRDSIPVQAIEIARKSVTLQNVVGGTISMSGVKAAVSFISGLIIYMFILIFGAQIMRSVVEEKTTRVIEIIVSSVKPFELMMGKIIGVALVGLTQLAVWIILSLIIIMPIIGAVQDKKLTPQQPVSAHTISQTTPVQESSGAGFEVNDQMEATVDTIMSIPWGNVILFFLLYFILGYLMYSAMFAAVGAAVNSEADSQQFMMPVTMPLIIAYSTSLATLTDSNGPVSFWLSMIPFTSPVSMMMRLPYGDIPIWQPVVSLVILFASFLFMTWLSGRIYRVGILMYGKKPSWRELGKWIFYKV